MIIIITILRIIIITIKDTRYKRAGWAEFIRKRDMKVATKPRMYATLVMIQYSLYLIPRVGKLGVNFMFNKMLIINHLPVDHSCGHRTEGVQGQEYHRSPKGFRSILIMFGSRMYVPADCKFANNKQQQ